MNPFLSSTDLARDPPGRSADDVQPKNPSANIRAYLQESVVPMLLTGLAEEHESAVQGESDERDPEQPLEDRGSPRRR